MVSVALLRGIMCEFMNDTTETCYYFMFLAFCLSFWELVYTLRLCDVRYRYLGFGFMFEIDCVYVSFMSSFS